jgi:predicted ester cyclase
VSEPSPQDVVTRYFAAANAHDPAGMAACWQPGGMEVLPALGLTLRAPDGLESHFTDLFSGIPDVTFQVIEQAATCNLVCVRSTMQGTHLGSYNGLAGTGRPFAVDVVDFIRVAGGLIASNHVVVDAMSTSRQLGVLPPTGSRPERVLLGVFNTLTRAKGPFRKRLRNETAA